MWPIVVGAALLARRRRKRRRPKVTVNRPPSPGTSGPIDAAYDNLIDAFKRPPVRGIPQGNGYVMITDRDDQEKQFLGRVLDFDVNRGFLGRGETEKVLLDGHVIYETQIRGASLRKLQERFMELFEVEQLSGSQVANILAEDEDDPMMFGDTADMDQAIEDRIEAELDELREEMEEEYAERFEREYQARFKQEYPGKFSNDYQEHYTDMVQEELDDVVDDHEDLYHEYIVTPKHIRYKR